jgi:hypothetical protein
MLDGAQSDSHRQPLQLARQRTPSAKNDFAVHDFAKKSQAKFGSHRQPLQLARQCPSAETNDSTYL